jgi:hypothetical protein
MGLLHPESPHASLESVTHVLERLLPIFPGYTSRREKGRAEARCARTFFTWGEGNLFFRAGIAGPFLLVLGKFRLRQ